MNIVVATDIGFDPDDYIALNLCLTNPNIDLAGIIVDPGHPNQVGLVKSILKFHDRLDVPVGGILEGPDKFFWMVDDTHGQSVKRLGVPLVPSNADVEGHELLDAIVKKHPDTTIVTIGSLYNLNQWVQKGNTKIKQSYSMGCYIGDPELNQPITASKHNFNSYEIGARALLNTGRITRKVLVSKNITHQAIYTKNLHARVEKIKGKSKGHEMIWDIMEYGTQYLPGSSMMHDPLTVFVALDESIVELVEVEVYQERGKWGY